VRPADNPAVDAGAFVLARSTVGSHGVSPVPLNLHNLSAAGPLGFMQLEYMTWPQALGLFAILSIPFVLLGIRSLAGLGPVRRWVALGLRLAVVALIVLILAGVKKVQTNEDVEVLVLKDVSGSTQLLNLPPNATYDQITNTFVADAVKGEAKRPLDRVGVISFDSSARIDRMPSVDFRSGARAIRENASGTDVAQAIQLALATMSPDAMHRLVLFWDGNATAGDLEAAIGAAQSRKVPIDVVPLNYDVTNEVLVDRFIAPSWKRENEPFTVEVILRSTNATAVTGKLTVYHQGEPMDMDDATPGTQPSRLVTLQPGRNVERVRVPAQSSAGVHQFKAVFEAPNVDASVAGTPTTPGAAPGGTRGAGAAARRQDTLADNNEASAFTFVRGKGQILYIDNAVPSGSGKFLRDALSAEGVAIDANRNTVDDFPNSLVELQNYDAVILNNVPRGAGGLTDEQEKMLAAYVHDLGGGLLMIGGPDTFGAGGWQGSKVEAILPIDMDVPAQRQIAKGALALVMHSCEMPNGNYWGEQCAIKAVETLAARDEVAVISYGWAGPGGGGSQFDYPLSPKGDGSKVIAAIKQMQLGDMPSFDDSMNVALNGNKTSPGLIASDARQKHIIVISDGDPQAPAPALIQAAIAAKISISTVSVFPHSGEINNLPRVMHELAMKTGGRAYGPINNNPNQLPQIFIKEATIVRRSLINEDKAGLQLDDPNLASEVLKGIGSFPNPTGMVLSTAKNSPQVTVALRTRQNKDPLFAHWQTGLGRAAAWTSDAHNRWAAGWLSGGFYSTFWSQAVRLVARPPESSDFDVQVTAEGGKGRIVVEALDRESQFKNFLAVNGTVMAPNGEAVRVRLEQIAPGTYAADFDAKQGGNYVVGLTWQDPKGNSGQMRSGTAVNSSPEMRNLKSDAAQVQRIADATGGRVLNLDGRQADLFTRAGLAPGTAPQPWWETLLPWLLGLVLLDVAVRRIAVETKDVKRAVGFVGDTVKSFTGSRKVESGVTLDALKQKRAEVAETRLKTPAGTTGAASTGTPAAAPPAPDRTRKFEAGEGVAGDITQVVGGATNQPIPSAPKNPKPKAAAPGAQEGGMSSLLEAKKRAQEKMREKEKGG
jgi:uncharacterized membrane protein